MVFSSGYRAAKSPPLTELIQKFLFRLVLRAFLKVVLKRMLWIPKQCLMSVTKTKSLIIMTGWIMALGVKMMICFLSRSVGKRTERILPSSGEAC